MGGDASDLTVSVSKGTISSQAVTCRAIVQQRWATSKTMRLRLRESLPFPSFHHIDDADGHIESYMNV